MALRLVYTLCGDHYTCREWTVPAGAEQRRSDTSISMATERLNVYTIKTVRHRAVDFDRATRSSLTAEVQMISIPISLSLLTAGSDLLHILFPRPKIRYGGED